jgi:hypothetical protein
MPQKPKPQPDNPEQFKRFLETAREVEVDESPEALERALNKVLRPKSAVIRNRRHAPSREGKVRDGRKTD